MPAAGIPLGDIIGDSGYAHRDADAWAIPLRAAGAQLVQDLHPHDRGPRGTHEGAIIANGNLYCPRTPEPLLELGAAAARRHRRADRRARPADRRALPPQARPAHRRRRRRLPPRHLPRRRRQDPLPAPPGVDDPGPGPARDPRPRPSTRRPAAPSRPSPSRPTVAAKTRQKHDYPSAAWRRSYPRRTAPNGLNATIKDTATTSIARGWCRLTGLAPLTLWIACLLVVRNQRILTAWDARQHDDARRAAAGLPPRTRKRRRTTLAQLAAGRHNHPARPAATTAARSRSQAPARPSRAARARSHAARNPGTGIHDCNQHHGSPHGKIIEAAGRMSDPNVNMEPGEV